MRVFLQSLRNAAGDYRTQANPSAPLNLPTRAGNDDVVLVPLLKFRLSSRRWWLPCALFVAMVLGAAGTAAIFRATGEEKVSMPPLPSQVVVEKRGSVGIALPVESLKEQEALAKAEKALPPQIILPLAAQDIAPPLSYVEIDEAPPWSAEEKLAQAQTMVAARHYAAADHLYEEILAQEPRNPEAWAGRLSAFEQSGADEAIKETAASHPRLAVAQKALARLLTRKDDEESALAAWKKAVELDPTDIEARLGLAILYDRSGQSEDALAQYTQVEPRTEDVQRRMAYLAGMVGR